jgi:hypothetical protein
MKEKKGFVMTNQNNPWQAQPMSQEGVHLLEDQHLEQIVGGGGSSQILVRRVTPEIGRVHPNNGTYIPPSDPSVLKILRIKPSNVPENHSYTWSADGKNIIQHIRPSY